MTGDRPTGPVDGFTERGRDLTLLALGVFVAVEAAFLVTHMILLNSMAALVLGAGRFAFISAMAYMAGQGFPIPRWLLVVLAAVWVLVAPAGVHSALSEGLVVLALVNGAGALGYAVAGVLLAGSRDVGAFLRHRRALRNADAM
jgi:hypothetical protein